jgi:polyhydroxyalkanoate synthesis repressor PhaR
VTLQDIEDLVLEGKTVEIRDSKTGEDLTRQVLTQILMERHPHKMDLFPVAMLHSVLRANDMMMDLWRGYLRQSLAATQAWQKAANPFAAPVDWVSALLPTLGDRPTARPASGDRDDFSQRLDDLAARIADLENPPRPEARTSPTPQGQGQGRGHDPISRLEERIRRLETSPKTSPKAARRPKGKPRGS